MPASRFASPLAVPAGSGVRTSDHFIPFQRRAWFTWAPMPPLVLPSVPTAQQRAGEVQLASWSRFMAPALVPSGLGTATLDHFLPFQCSIWFSAVIVLPTVS